jgi:VWFA-related protein
VYLAAKEKLQREVGRKALVIITDGVDQGSRTTLSEAIASAHRADTIIYSIQYVDPNFYGYFGASDGELKKMSEETGGCKFRVDRKNTLDSIFEQIQQELRTQYSIGYTPANPKKDGAFHKVEIKTARKDLKVQARKGYFAAAD